MAEDYLLGVDVGTTSSKGIICDVRGRSVAEELVEHGVSRPKPGWAEQDADAVWWADVVTVVRSLLAQRGIDPRRIAAIGCSATNTDILLLDQAGIPIRPGILYIDQRSGTQAAKIDRILGLQRITELYGRSLSSGSAVAHLLWLKEHESESFARTRLVLSANNYLTYRLTGERVLDNINARNMAPLYDRVEGRWRPDIAAELGLPPQLLPQRVAWAHEVAGSVTPEAAGETGLAAGTPVIVGTADSFAALVGAGVVSGGQVGLIYGTLLALMKCLPGPAVGHELPHCIPGVHLVCGGVETAGALTRWFRDNFGQREMEAEAKSGTNAYHSLSQLASQVPAGSDGLIVLPYFASRGGTLNGLRLRHGRAHIYRALLEGTAYALRIEMEDLGGDWPERVTAMDGGTKSRLWTQIVSDVTGLVQDCLTATSCSVRGDAYLAGMAVGLFRDFQPLHSEWLIDSYSVRPRREAREAYKHCFSRYASLLNNLD